MISDRKDLLKSQIERTNACLNNWPFPANIFSCILNDFFLWLCFEKKEKQKCVAGSSFATLFLPIMQTRTKLLALSFPVPFPFFLLFSLSPFSLPCFFLFFFFPFSFAFLPSCCYPDSRRAWMEMEEACKVDWVVCSKHAELKVV